MSYLLQFLQLYFGFLQSANFGFTTTAPNGAILTQIGLSNSSIHLLSTSDGRYFLAYLISLRDRLSLIITIVIYNNNISIF